MSYTIKYTVVATSRLEAIERASALLRTGLRLNSVVSADPSESKGPIWVVVLHVWEDV